MLSLLLCLLLQQPGAQAPAAQPWPVADSESLPPVAGPVAAPAAAQALTPAATNSAELGLWTNGVAAPAQPSGSSRATLTTSPRINNQLARGRSSRSMVRVKDLARVRGQEENRVYGIGIVLGLAGTGDSGLASRLALSNLLRTQNINLNIAQITSNNVAVVMVEATLPPGAKPGRLLDARVSSMYDSESLDGGNLVFSELSDALGTTVYAIASGAISTGAISAEGDGASVTRNHLTVGRIPLGAKIERAVPSRLSSEQGVIYLDLLPRSGGFGNSVRVADAVNSFYPGVATPMDAMSVQVTPDMALSEGDLVRYVASLLAVQFEPEASARIVINERTGVIVLGEEVRIGRGAITKGNLTVTISETPQVSQPGPLSEGETVVVPRTDINVQEENRALTLVPGAATLAEVVEVLNVLGVTPRDMIQILQSMSASGMLHGELIIQ